MKLNKIGKIIEIKEGIFNEKKYEVNDIVVQILEDIDKQINMYHFMYEIIVNRSSTVPQSSFKLIYLLN